MRKFFTILAACSMVVSFAFGQDVRITGTVTDQQTGEALVGANVLIKGTARGTITDVNGKYTIEAPSQSTLVFSFLGYHAQEIAVGNQSVIDVALEPDVSQLSEVVVTALGIERDERTLGFSAEKVEGKTISETNENNVLNALKGRVAGLQIMDNNGVDGGTTRITIRGNNSLVNGKNQPLIIVDGVQIENSITGPGATSMTSNSTGKDWGSGINNINPWDIESITVLKGPNAAALYGSRGSNGVIVITTKKGKKSEGLGLDFSVNYMATQPYGFRDVQNVRGGGTIGYYENNVVQGTPFETTDIDGTTYNLLPTTSFWGSGASWGPEMDGTPVLWWDGEVRPWEPQPDNLETFFHTGFNSTYNLAFSGASDLGSVRVSLTRNDVDAITPNTDRYQNTLNLNSSLNVSKRVRADISVSYINSYMKNSPQLGNSESSIGKNLTWNWYRSYRPDLEAEKYELPDGTRAPAGKGRPGIDAIAGYPAWNYRGLGRTGAFYWNIWNNNTTRDRDRVIGSIALNYDITDWLSIKGSLGLDFYNDDTEYKAKPYDSEGLLGGRYSHTMGKNQIQNHNVMLRFNKSVGKDFVITAFVGGETWHRKYYQIQGDNGGRNFVDPYLYTFRNIDYPTDDNNKLSVWWVRNRFLPTENRYEKQVNSVFGSVSLSWRDFLNLDVTGRNDWSSTLPPETRSYFYPAVQTSFIFSEAFGINSKILSFGKIRLSWAQAGNDTEPYQVTPTYKRNSFGGQDIATVDGTIPPTQLRSELSSSWEGGIKLEFFDRRLGLDFAYYYIKSTNQIMRAPVPRSSGFGSLRFNSGEVENKGYEIIASATPVRTKNFSWDITFNMNSNRNKIISLAEGAETLYLGGIFGGNGPSVEARPGQEYGTIMGWDYTYYDKNGNGETDPDEITPDNRLLTDDGMWYVTTQDRVPIGNVVPRWTGGLINTFTYKGLSLNVILDIRQGGDVFYGSMSAAYGMGQSPATLKGWTAEYGGLSWTDDEGVSRNDGVIKEGVLSDGSKNDIVVPYWAEHANVFTWGPGDPVTPLIYETSWVRLQQLALTWNLPMEWMRSVGFIQNASITFIGRDLFFLQNTAPDNLNPAGVNGAGNSQGMEWGSLPITRSFGGSLRVSF